MSGHSKWSTIKRKKAALDSKRGKVFTRLLKEVTVAARMGGGDPNGNPRLRAAMQECKGNNVPNDKVDRAIKKGTGELSGGTLDEVVYEGYGPGGVAVMVETLTDNRNRTVSEVRHTFTKFGGSLGENGCVSYIFEKKGYFLIEPETMDEEAFMELALDLEVEDIATENGSYEIFTAPERYQEVRDELANREVEVSTSELGMIPKTSVEVEDGQVPTMMRFLEAMEELDDVQSVWANFDANEQAMEAD